MVCLLAAPWVQLSVSAGNGWPHNALRHHWLMPISCHFRDCKALLVTSLAHVSGTIASVQTFTFYLYIKLVLQWGFAMVLHSTVWQSSLLLTIAIWKWQKKICPTHSRIGIGAIMWCTLYPESWTWQSERQEDRERTGLAPNGIGMTWEEVQWCRIVSFSWFNSMYKKFLLYTPEVSLMHDNFLAVTLSYFCAQRVLTVFWLCHHNQFILLLVCVSWTITGQSRNSVFICKL